jgi:hypothetical protein
MPPKGVRRLRTIQQFIHAMPVWIFDAVLCAREYYLSKLLMLNRISAVAIIKTILSLKGINVTTGPKISSWFVL